MTQKERQIIIAVKALELPSEAWSVIETINRHCVETTAIAVDVRWGSDIVEFTGYEPTIKGKMCWYWDAEEEEENIDTNQKKERK